MISGLLLELCKRVCMLKKLIEWSLPLLVLIVFICKKLREHFNLENCNSLLCNVLEGNEQMWWGSHSHMWHYCLSASLKCPSWPQNHSLVFWGFLSEIQVRIRSSWNQCFGVGANQSCLLVCNKQIPCHSFFSLEYKSVDLAIGQLSYWGGKKNMCPHNVGTIIHHQNPRWENMMTCISDMVNVFRRWGKICLLSQNLYALNGIQRVCVCVRLNSSK